MALFIFGQKIELMVDISYIREHFDEAVKGLEKRNVKNTTLLLKDLIKLDDQRKKNQYNLDKTLAKSNTLSKKIGSLYKEGKAKDAERLKKDADQLKGTIKDLQDQQQKIEHSLEEQLLHIPNIPHESVVQGVSDEDNEIVRTWGSEADLELKSKLPHWELAKKYQIFDLEAGAKITGSGFPVYTGRGAQLQRALINYFLDKGNEAGYYEVSTPFMVNESSARGTGQLPDKEGQMYEMKLDPYYLIPTSEVPVTNLFRNEVIDQKKLPLKRVAYSPCFRREAGSYGAHVRGLNRLHQFDKVEIVQVVHPNKSHQTLDEMVDYVERLVQSLNLPYRVLRLCGGDLTFASSLTYDIEVFSAAQEKWLEVSSISNFQNFQAHRLNLKIKNNEGKRVFAHTLNGSAIALPRIVAALLENNQTESGINIPKVLNPYLGFKEFS